MARCLAATRPRRANDRPFHTANLNQITPLVTPVIRIFDILAEWPPDFDKPALATLQRWLRRAVESRLMQCEGTGRKADPYHYWLPETEAKSREQNPFDDRCQEQMRDLKLPYRSLQEMRRRDRGDDGTGLVGDNADDGSDNDN